MAFSLALLFYKGEIKEPFIRLEPCYWNRAELLDKHLFRKELDYYLDYYLDVDLESFKKIHEDQLRHTKSGFFANEFWRGSAARDAAQIDNLINSGHNFSKITVWIFEYDGMG